MDENDIHDQVSHDSIIRCPASRRKDPVKVDITDVARSMQTFDARLACQLLGIHRETLRKLMHERRIKGYYQGNRLRVPAWSLMQYQETRNRAWREDEKRLRVAHLSPKRIANVRKAQDVRRMIRENKKSIKESFLENNSQE